jgi:hypothetical protein
MEGFTIVNPALVMRSKAVRNYQRKTKNRIQDKQIETDHCVFISSRILGDKLDPDPVRGYVVDGEHSKAKEDLDRLQRIMRGLK